MKKITALLLIAVLWYFSGMYRQPAVMSLLFCAVLLVVIFFAMALYQRFHLNVTLPKSQIITFKNYQKPVSIYARNTSLLPVNYFRVVITAAYKGSKKRIRKKFNGSALGKKQNESNVSEFYLVPPYCGVIDLRIKKIRVYDNLALFSFSKRSSEEVRLLVFPVPKQMNIVMPLFGGYESIPLTENLSQKIGDDHTEVRQIRQYRPGDLNRYIHQNYSARTDSLWVKEYRKENDFVFDILIDTSSDLPLTAEQTDGLCEIVYSLIITLLKKDALMVVHWFDSEHGALRSFSVSGERDAMEMLAGFYNTNSNCTPQQMAGAAASLPMEKITVNSRLEWSFNDKPVYCFHYRKLEYELSSFVFSLRL